MQNSPLKQSPYIKVNYCSSTLLQQHRFQSSANRYQTTVTQLSDCSSKLYQQTVEPDDSDDLAYDGVRSSSKPAGSVLVSDAMPRLGHDRRRSSARMVPAHNLQNDRLNASGLMIRGSTFYARWMIPRPLQPILGKSHFVKSLRTKNAHDAKRLIRAVGWEYEELLRQAEGRVIQRLPTPSVAPLPDTQWSAKPKAKQKTFEQVFELFINDPTRKRAKKTIAGYRDGIEIIYAVVGRQILIYIGLSLIQRNDAEFLEKLYHVALASFFNNRRSGRKVYIWMAEKQIVEAWAEYSARTRRAANFENICAFNARCDCRRTILM